MEDRGQCLEGQDGKDDFKNREDFILPLCGLQDSCHLFSSIMATLQHLMKPKIAKKRTNKFIWHQSDRCVKIRQNWQKARCIDIRVQRSGAKLWCQHQL